MKFKQRVKFTVLIVSALLISCTEVQPGDSKETVISNDAVEKNGQLRVCGTKLCNENGVPIQLRGMSTHGLQWYGWGGCITEESLDTLAFGWDADILRISLYVQEGGYESDPSGFTAQVKTIINHVTQRGMYALVDWHQLSPGDPNYNLEMASNFFADIVETYKDHNNIIYDICNEPSDVSWSQIKTYADELIPLIRDIDSDAVILIGTHGWASLGVSDGRSYRDIVADPVNFDNVMYTFHFYAASHKQEYLNALDSASNVLPIFVTEFGTQEYTGDGSNDFVMSQAYIDLMVEKKISWVSWNFSDDFRSGAVWNTETCTSGQWTEDNLKQAGQWIRERILVPEDDFPTEPVQDQYRPSGAES